MLLCTVLEHQGTLQVCSSGGPLLGKGHSKLSYVRARYPCRHSLIVKKKNSVKMSNSNYKRKTTTYFSAAG